MLLLLSLACSWNLPDAGYADISGTWDPDIAVAADGVYVKLTEAHALLRVTPDGGWSEVDLDGARPNRVVASPDGLNLLVSASWPVCDDDDPSIRTVSDCPDERLSWEHELSLVKDGVSGGAIEDVGGQQTATAFSPDNSKVALYYDFGADSDIEIDGVLDLTAVTILDLDAGEAHPVSVGFPAESVLISPDSETAVVLSRSEVAVIALTPQDNCDAYQVCVSYSLSLDTDHVVQPTGVALLTTSDVDGGENRYALVTVAGSSDLYILNLSAESIDIKELSGTPSAIAVVTGDDGKNYGVITYNGRAEVDVLDDEYFEITPFELDEAMGNILVAEGDVLLYQTGNNKDVYHFDPRTGDVIEQRAENPIDEVQLADQGMAVSVMRPESSGGSGASGFYDQNYVLGLIDLADAPGDEPKDQVSLALEAAPVGLATTQGDTGSVALVLLSGIDTLLRIDLATGTSDGVELEDSPLGIVATPAGGFVVTHDAAAGMLSFVDADGAITTVSGFGTYGLFSEELLPRRDEE